MTEDDLSTRPVQPLAEADLDDPVVARLGREIDPPSRPAQAMHAAGRAVRSMGRWGPESWVTLAIVAGCVLFTFTQLSPSDIFSASTPAGGDMGAHVWGPAYMRDHLLPSFRLTGWTPDWYAGFPAYQFYMVLPSLAIALLSFILPYGLAFKLVAISGVLTLPIACWAFGRLTRLPFPVSPLLAVGATAFLFDRSFSIYGGNIASTLAGEFAFSISLSIAIVFLGVVGRGLETGRQRVIAPILLALTGLCHLIPFLFAIGGAIVWLAVSLARKPGFIKRVWWLACTGVVGVALMGWWLFPFYLRSGYMNDMGWEKKTNYLDLLFQRKTLDPQLVNSPPIQWVLVLALLGLVMSIAWKRRGGMFLAVLAGATAFAFVLLPQGKLWNARLLPFWYLSLYLLAAIGVAELGRTIASLLSPDPDTPRRSITIATAVVAALAGLTVLAMPLRAMPEKIALGPVKIELGGVQKDGQYHWLFLSTKESSFVPSWARWNFSGYEGKPAYPEYHDIVQTMGQLGETNGCGRAMWEHEEQHDRYGTPMALMLLPFWTDGCIGSMEGLFFEASSTTPYHFINQDELSFGASNAQRDLPYMPGAPDQAQFDLGVDHLQMLGVKYYMAITEQMITYGQANASLKQVAQSGPWIVFEVADSSVVEPLDNDPAVLTGVAPKHWLESVTPWYMDPTAWNVWPSSGGPKDWQRIAEGETPTANPTTPVAVTNTQIGRDTISFDVTKPGTPILVKVSYFPNWKVSGAEGPWRVGPNLMVVVPTSDHVTLSYGMTMVDWGSWFATILGVVGIVLLWRAGPLVFPAVVPWFRPRSSKGNASDDGDDDDDVEPALDEFAASGDTESE
ncbi:unannotated protein [freshwater metagenome]|jgi:hypothetical protein|uniref:Unannotated protein n=1 Tax=freshwater metagenome TaxID=449393 RepID=A0A6J6GNE3_9ZZZZ|nr:hypothetical protein [Actinomycetota bacterium]